MRTELNQPDAEELKELQLLSALTVTVFLYMDEQCETDLSQTKGGPLDFTEICSAG